jgi:diketogulonate reductase-like aldo/keto reductase
MAVTAYCGMAVGRVFDEPLLMAIAARYGKSMSQIVLRWLIQQEGVVALSRTTNEQRVAENVAVFDFELAPEGRDTQPCTTEQPDREPLWSLSEMGLKARIPAVCVSVHGSNT